MQRNKLVVDEERELINMVNCTTGGSPAHVTSVAVWHEEAALKLLYVCSDDDIISKGKDYNDKLYEGDVVELFITLGADSRYLELEVNPLGVKYAAVITNANCDGVIEISLLSEPPFTATTSFSGRGWQAELTIPYDKLTALGWEPKASRINLYRQDYSKKGELRLYALNPTYKSTFHIPASFIPLVLE